MSAVDSTPHCNPARMAKEAQMSQRMDVHEPITNRIIEAIEKGAYAIHPSLPQFLLGLSKGNEMLKSAKKVFGGFQTVDIKPVDTATIPYVVDYAEKLMPPIFGMFILQFDRNPQNGPSTVFVGQRVNEGQNLPLLGVPEQKLE